MLVLSRKLNESILIPGLNVTIRVASVEGGKVRLAIDAPREVTILREEVAERMGVSPAHAPKTTAGSPKNLLRADAVTA